MNPLCFFTVQAPEWTPFIHKFLIKQTCVKHCRLLYSIATDKGKSFITPTPGRVANGRFFIFAFIRRCFVESSDEGWNTIRRRARQLRLDLRDFSDGLGSAFGQVIARKFKETFQPAGGQTRSRKLWSLVWRGFSSEKAVEGWSENLPLLDGMAGKLVDDLLSMF